MSRAERAKLGKENLTTDNTGKRVCGCGSVGGKERVQGFKKVQTRLTALVQIRFKEGSNAPDGAGSNKVQKGSNAPDGAGSKKVQSRLTALVQ
jgi:hypothetical protein